MISNTLMVRDDTFFKYTCSDTGSVTSYTCLLCGASSRSTRSRRRCRAPSPPTAVTRDVSLPPLPASSSASARHLLRSRSVTNVVRPLGSAALSDRLPSSSWMPRCTVAVSAPDDGAARPYSHPADAPCPGRTSSPEHSASCTVRRKSLFHDALWRGRLKKWKKSRLPYTAALAVGREMPRDPRPTMRDRMPPLPCSALSTVSKPGYPAGAGPGSPPVSRPVVTSASFTRW